MEIQLFDDDIVAEPLVNNSEPRFFLFDKSVLINIQNKPNYPHIITPLFEMFKQAKIKFRIVSDHQIEEENDPLTAITSAFLENKDSVKKNLRKSIALTVSQIEQQTLINIDEKSHSIAQKSLSKLHRNNEKIDHCDIQIGEMKIKLDTSSPNWNEFSDNRLVIFSLLTALEKAKLTIAATEQIKAFGIMSIETTSDYRPIKLDNIIFINKHFDANSILKKIGVTVYDSNLISFSRKIKDMLTENQYKNFTLNCDRYEFVESIKKEIKRIDGTRYFFEDPVLKKSKIEALNRFIYRVTQQPELSPENLINKWTLEPQSQDDVRSYTIEADMKTLADHRRPFLRVILNLLPIKTSSLGIFKPKNEMSQNGKGSESVLKPPHFS